MRQLEVRRAGPRRQVFVNEAFRGQRVSGQQRYAAEIAERLPTQWKRVRPSGWWAGSRIGTWLWLQLVLPLRTWRGVLVTLTARGPLVHPRQVVAIHDMFVLDHPEWYSKAYYVTHAPLQLAQMRSAASLIAVSEPTAQELRERRVTRPVRVAPNAASAVFRPGPVDANLLQQHGLVEGHYFVAVGNLEPRKNLRRLASAYGMLPEDVREQWPLAVIGGSADVFAESGVGWPSGVRQLGRVSDDELRTLYSASGAVVFVSLAEGFGLPLVEAGLAGAPTIICSDIEVFRWICGSAAVYVDPLDTRAIGEALQLVVKGEAPARPFDPSRFDWQKSADVVRLSASAVAEDPPAPSPQDEPAPGDVAIIIASAGRPELLGDLLARLGHQSLPHTLAVCVPDEASLPPGGLPEGTRLAHARGLTAQRNAAIALVPEAKYIFTFDDDAVVREDYLEQGVKFFQSRPDVVALTGRVLLDGAAGDEITAEQADAALAESATEPCSGESLWSRSLYGCNFAFRQSATIDERFDERLPLYSWLEDHDFARRMMRYGSLALVDDCVIVHRGVKSGGRQSHVRLGYTQMMNPLYLRHKGSFPAWLAAWEIVFRCGKNVVYSVAGREVSWRRERLKGNALALWDVLRGRYTPERMTEL